MIKFIQPPGFSSPDVRAFFTTKIMSNPAESVKAVADESGISEDRIYLPVQKHTGTVHILKSDMKPVVADAVVTGRRGVLIGVLVADCVPVLVYEPVRKVAGAVHAGWRGTAQQILKNTIAVMCEKFDCLPRDMSVAIGPSIRQCSYEVGREVKEGVERATGEGSYYRREGEKFFIDIAFANKIQALSMNVREENIWQSRECTFCNPEKYHSYRFSGDCTGRQGGFIIMW
jgi:YfiH family protein